MNDLPTVIGVMLAGGKARRMGGGDKCLLPLLGQTLLQRATERAKPQVEQLLLSVNGNPLRFARTRLPVIADVTPDQPGPLAGIYSAMLWMQQHAPQASWLASFASDAPFFPENQVRILVEHALANEQQLVIASANNRLQPAFALWHINLLPDVRHLMETNPDIELRQWVAEREMAVVDFSHPQYDPFFNINTPQDLYAAEAMLLNQ